jgi:very-short-patch-repair endonuclease
LFCSRQCLGSYTVRYKQNRISKPEQAFLDEVALVVPFVIRRQEPLGGFVADGYIAEHRLVIEFDGEYWHSFSNVQAKDRRKDAAYSAIGLRVVHVPERTYLDDPEAAIALVEAAIKEVGNESVDAA